MSSTQQIFSLEKYAVSVLETLGLGDMTPSQRQKYIPRLVHQIEYRLGAGLLPGVPDAEAPEFQKLLETNADASAWLAFWQRVVPDFEKKVKKILQDFAAECKKILA